LLQVPLKAAQGEFQAQALLPQAEALAAKGTPAQ
jgi:hypothetical protein